LYIIKGFLSSAELALRITQGMASFKRKNDRGIFQIISTAEKSQGNVPDKLGGVGRYSKWEPLEYESGMGTLKHQPLILLIA
jgi:hypothetical protein